MSENKNYTCPLANCATKATATAPATEVSAKHAQGDAFFNESIYSDEAASFSQQQLTDHMAYAEGMEVLDSTLLDEVTHARAAYDYSRYTEADVRRALEHEHRTVEDFAALLSPAALPLLEDIARAAQKERQRYFGNSVTFFTPLYIANYCENYCIYCGFNSHNHIQNGHAGNPHFDGREPQNERCALYRRGLQAGAPIFQGGGRGNLSGEQR